jgi:hypothetical protein
LAIGQFVIVFSGQSWELKQFHLHR